MIAHYFTATEDYPPGAFCGQAVATGRPECGSEQQAAKRLLADRPWQVVFSCSCDPRISVDFAEMKIYTKTGDAGDTGLFGGGRVQTDDPRVEAYGDVDELNGVIGMARGAARQL